MWALIAVLLAQSAADQITDYQADGLKALDAQKYDLAAELFNKAVAQDPKDYSARFNLALAYSFLGKDGDAIPQYRAVLAEKPGLYEAQINLGILLLRSKDAAGALPYLKSAAEQKPKEYRPVYYYAESLQQTGALADAETTYSTAISLKPDSADAELGLAQTQLHEKKLAESESHFRKAAALNAKYKNSILELAVAYEQNHQTAEAIAIYRDFPENPGAQERMGALLASSGDTASAIPALESAVAKSPTAANRVALALAYQKNKQIEKALTVAAQAVIAEPKAYDLRMFLGRMLRDARRPEAAATQFTEATHIKTDSVEAWNELAGVLVTGAYYMEALSAFDHLKALRPETAADYYFRAICYDHLRLLKDALAAYNKFLESSQGKNPDEEFKARQRVRIIEHELGKR